MYITIKIPDYFDACYDSWIPTKTCICDEIFFQGLFVKPFTFFQQQNIMSECILPNTFGIFICIPLSNTFTVSSNHTFPI